ncbi:MAG: hypothetical protein ACKODX_16405, partial [Gemmata sp.]
MLWPIVLLLLFVLLSTVLASVARLLNNLQEANTSRRLERERHQRAERERAARAQRDDERAERPAPRARPAAGPEREGGTVRTGTTDMDRFLAEIDRLRRKAAASPDPLPAQPGSAVPVAQVVQPARPP